MPIIDTVEQLRFVYAQPVEREIKRQLSRIGNVVAAKARAEKVERYRTQLY